ncbi:DMT family transporter [Mesorhizobium carmichaelinearum]|uniref:DMT family transporter n=1 Tax=Mesorhizobium carmichaelinearum TaxID=1208188 RepID=UPI000BA4388B|nr:SMR family transporter [Mesorhizobium carmichaelinearum]
MNRISLIQVLLSGVNSSIGSILLKWSRTSLPVDAGFADKFLSAGFIGGAIFYSINVVLYAKALDSVEVSLAYPIVAGSGFAIVTVAACYIFGEPFHLFKWIGLSLVLAGITFLAQGG